MGHPPSPLATTTPLGGVSATALLVLGPPLAARSRSSLPLAVFVGLQFAFLLFVFVMGWGLLGSPRSGAARRPIPAEYAKSWKLRPE